MIEVINLTRFAVDKRFFGGVAKKVLAGENRETENVSLVFVGAQKMRELNRDYRHKDHPTDVLSFARSFAVGQDMLEVIICPSVVFSKARETGMGNKAALADAVIHGLLHALGYEHEGSAGAAKTMFAKQSYYLSKVKV